MSINVWEERFIEQGHTFQMGDPDDGLGNEIDWFADAYEFHNGPRCVTCGYSCCMHCTPADSIPKCTRSLTSNIE